MKIIGKQEAVLINGGCGTKQEHPWYDPNAKEKEHAPCSLDFRFRPKPHSYLLVVYGSLEE